MDSPREPLDALKRKALWQVLFLVSTALVLYLVRLASVEPVPSDVTIEPLRRLAASPPPMLRDWPRRWIAISFASPRAIS